MLLAILGIIAPAATATKPAMSAYSMRSWPRVSLQIRSRNKNLFKLFTTTPLSESIMGEGPRYSAQQFILSV